MDDALFELGDESPVAPPIQPVAARGEQVAMIRKALDDAGVMSQDDRRNSIHSVVLSDVNSLKDLTAVQARRVLDRLNAINKPTRGGKGTSWDNREHDTWIDKM